MKTILVIDCETTGLDASDGHAVVEVAVVPVVYEEKQKRWIAVNCGASSLVAPGRHVPPEASAVHHLVDADLRNERHLVDALKYCVVTAMCSIFYDFDPNDVDSVNLVAIAAHNADFDCSFLGAYIDSCLFTGASDKRSWLCTYRLAQHLFPDAPSYKNQALRYYLPAVAERSVAALAVIPIHEAMPHRALYDAVVTAELLVEELSAIHCGTDIRSVRELQDRDVLQKRVHFGQHRGSKWSDVPKSYLRWVLDPARSPPFDRDVLHTAGYHQLMKREVTK